MSRLLTFLRRCAPAGAGLLLAAMALRYGWRDTRAFSAPTFYALPLPLHLIGWLCLAAVWRRGHRGRSWGSLAMALTCGVLWFINTVSLQRKVNAVSPQPGPRLFFWNIGHVKSVPSAVHELLRSHDPDAAAFAEAENLLPAHHLELAGQHPGYQVMPLPGGMLCMVKGTVSLSSYTTLPQRSCVQVLDTAFTRFPGPPWRICLADVGPLPPLPRMPVLTEIFKVARGSPRTLVAADFNTPLDSAAFDEWRDNFHHAHADCPEFHGPLETWGFGFPVLAIDHLWLSPDLVPLRADKGSHFRQDHSWILVETGITPGNRDTTSSGGAAN